MTAMPSNNQSIVTHLSRQPAYPINPLFVQRWSPRAFDDSPLTHEELMMILEAARWAPSAYNVQPWRFLYALRGDAHWQQYLDLLDPFNAGWARHSGALVFLLSDTLMESSEGHRPLRSHSLDAGAAWMQLALQAQLNGFSTHAMGGIFHRDVHQQLNVPDRYQVEIGIAIGRQGETSRLPESLQEREQPSARKALSELAWAGTFHNQTGDRNERG